MFDSSVPTSEIRSELKTLDGEGVKDVLRFVHHVRDYPELQKVRMWLFNKLLNKHDRVLGIALNILMFIAPIIIRR